MPATTLAQNFKTTAQVVREDLGDALRARRNPPPVGLEGRQLKALEDVRRNGFAVIEGYWKRDRALVLRDRLEAYLAEGKKKDFDEGAWLRFWDDRPHDQGVRRIYHVERLIPELKELRHDPFVMDIVKAYYGMDFHSNVLVFQHNTQSNEHTRYYHVDAFVREFKAFVYLDDVDKGNGPFAYLRGTHKNHFTRLRKQVVGNGEDESPTSFFEDDLRSQLDSEVQVLGPAGTLILSDVRGLHRGTPQAERSRSVLVNYILKHAGDIEIDK